MSVVISHYIRSDYYNFLNIATIKLICLSSSLSTRSLLVGQPSLTLIHTHTKWTIMTTALTLRHQASPSEHVSAAVNPALQQLFHLKVSVNVIIPHIRGLLSDIVLKVLYHLNAAFLGTAPLLKTEHPNRCYNLLTEKQFAMKRQLGASSK